MDSIVETLAKTAGIGGIAVGIFLLAFYQFMKRVRSGPVPDRHFATILVIFIVAAWTIALAGIGAYVYLNHRPDPAAPSVVLPGGSAWVHIGYFEIGNPEHFLEGPYAEIVKSAYTGSKKFSIMPGDIIAMTAKRPVKIVNFQNTGTAQASTPPTAIPGGAVRPEDNVGIDVPSGSRWLVRDAVAGAYPTNSQAALWIRIVSEP